MDNEERPEDSVRLFRVDHGRFTEALTMIQELDTPLNNAIREGDLRAVKALIASGANKTQPNCTGQTPLQYAAGKKQLEICLELLSYKECQNQLDIEDEYSVSETSYSMDETGTIYATSMPPHETTLGGKILILAIEDENNNYLEEIFEKCQEFLNFDGVNGCNHMIRAIQCKNEKAIKMFMPHYSELLDNSDHDALNDVLECLVAFDEGVNISNLELFFKYLPNDKDFTEKANFECNTCKAVLNLMDETNGNILDLFLGRNILQKSHINYMLCYALVLEKEECFNTIIDYCINSQVIVMPTSSKIISEHLGTIFYEEVSEHFNEKIKNNNIAKTILDFTKSIINSKVTNDCHQDILKIIISRSKDKYDPLELCEEILAIDGFLINWNRVPGNNADGAAEIVHFKDLSDQEMVAFTHYLKTLSKDMAEEQQNTFLEGIKKCHEILSTQDIKGEPEEVESAGSITDVVMGGGSSSSSSQSPNPGDAEIPPAGENPGDSQHLDG